MTTRIYNITGGGLIHAYGCIQGFQRIYYPEDLSKFKTDRGRQEKQQSLYECIFMLGSMLPDMPFKHVLSLAERRAKVTPVGDDGACRIEIDD